MELQLNLAETQELEFLRTLSHPNIVRYLGYDKDETYIYIFMEYALPRWFY